MRSADAVCVRACLGVPFPNDDRMIYTLIRVQKIPGATALREGDQ